MRRRGDLATADHKRMRLAHDFARARAHRAPGLEKEEDVGTSLAPPSSRAGHPLAGRRDLTSHAATMSHAAPPAPEAGVPTGCPLAGAVEDGGAV